MKFCYSSKEMSANNTIDSKQLENERRQFEMQWICTHTLPPNAMQVIGRRAANRANDAGSCRWKSRGSIVSVALMPGWSELTPRMR